jgi:hypothetical protein
MRLCPSIMKFTLCDSMQDMKGMRKRMTTAHDKLRWRRCLGMCSVIATWQRRWGRAGRSSVVDEFQHVLQQVAGLCMLLGLGCLRKSARQHEAGQDACKYNEQLMQRYITQHTTGTELGRCPDSTPAVRKQSHHCRAGNCRNPISKAQQCLQLTNTPSQRSRCCSTTFKLLAPTSTTGIPLQLASGGCLLYLMTLMLTNKVIKYSTHPPDASPVEV